MTGTREKSCYKHGHFFGNIAAPECAVEAPRIRSNGSGYRTGCRPSDRKKLDQALAEAMCTDIEIASLPFLFFFSLFVPGWIRISVCLRSRRSLREKDREKGMLIEPAGAGFPILG